jgi:3' terminal RNA ribose 2'-O-methyltransferase Hen1
VTTPLHEQRLRAVQRILRARGARSVLDLGCGEGDLLTRLLAEPRIEKIVGIDASQDALQRLRARLETLTAHGPGARVELIHGSMTESRSAFAGFDCAVLLETVEHIDPQRLSVLERAVFATLRPAVVVITTPNAEFNPLLGIAANRFRHPDHRFEWGRSKFRDWTQGVARRNGYRVACSDLAGRHPEYGGASQMGVFDLVAATPHRIGA